MKTAIKILPVIILSFIALEVNAQAFQEKNVTLDLSLGIGSALYKGIPVEGSFEYGITNNIGLGARVGYAGYKESYFGYDLRVSAFVIGPQASYHFAEDLNLNVDNLDLYAGLFVGFASVSVKGELGEGYTEPGAWAYSFYAGAKYYVKPNLAVMGEFGYGIATLRLGVTLKLK